MHTLRRIHQPDCLSALSSLNRHIRTLPPHSLLTRVASWLVGQRLAGDQSCRRPAVNPEFGDLISAELPKQWRDLYADDRSLLAYLSKLRQRTGKLQELLEMTTFYLCKNHYVLLYFMIWWFFTNKTVSLNIKYYHKVKRLHIIHKRKIKQQIKTHTILHSC